MNSITRRALMTGAVAGALIFGAVVALAQERPGGGAPQPPAGGAGGQLPGAGKPTTPGPSGGGQLPGGTLPGGGQLPGKPTTPGPSGTGQLPGRPAPPTTPGDQRPALPDPNRGAQPAQPRPGEGRPAEPALPNNPRARDNVQDTPSRTGQTPSRTSLPANVSATSMVNGLTQVNIGTLNITNIQTNNIINVNSAMSNVQVQSLITAVQNNTQAASIAEQLTAKLIDARLITKGQQVVGFQDGRIFVTGGAMAGAGAGLGAGTGTGAGAIVTVTRDALLNGLVNVNLQNLNLQAGNVVNVNTSLNGQQVQGVIEALNVNADAKANADKLTTQLMTSGMLQEGQQVVGVIGDRIFITGGTK